jgi:nitrite reductase/ring-hydroxylating ferredoxin subunit
MRIVVYNVGGSYFATDERCAHQGGPLGEGLLEGSVVTCPWHAWQFDVRTGQAIYDPGVCVRTYPVRVEGDDIFVEV